MHVELLSRFLLYYIHFHYFYQLGNFNVILGIFGG